MFVISILEFVLAIDIEVLSNRRREYVRSTTFRDAFDKKKGKFEGQGEMKWAGGRKWYKGVFKKGTFHGRGIKHLENGNEETGQWVS